MKPPSAPLLFTIANVDRSPLLRGVIPHVFLLLLHVLLIELAIAGVGKPGTGGPDGEVPQGQALWGAVHGEEGVFELKQAAAREGEFVLVRLVHGADGVVEEGRAGLLDVVAEDVRYRLVF